MLDIYVTPRARLQIARASRWWAENRHSAPDAIAIDLQDTFETLTSQPGIGAKSRSSRYPHLRRFYVRRIRYHVYYTVAGNLLVVVAFWHASREKGPAL